MTSSATSDRHEGRPTLAAIDEISRALHASTRRDPLGDLTRAERHVAGLVRQGMSNNEVAAHLVISRRTVESRLAGIYRKLDIRSHTQLAAMPAEISSAIGSAGGPRPAP